MSTHRGEKGAPGLSATRGLAFYLGAVLGTGVLALPGLAAQAAGPASLIAWSVLIVASVPIAWTFALLGARMPDPGGASTYVRTAFGDSAAACCGWAFYLTVPIGVPASAYFAGNYVANAVGGGRGTTLLVTGSIVAAVLLCNVVGIRTSSAAALGVAAVLVVVVVIAVVVSAPHAQLAHLRPFAPHGWSAIGAAVALIVWAFAGWEAMSHLGGEFRDPQRDLRRVTVAALVIVGVLYLALAAAVVLVLGPRAGTSVAPLADLLSYGVGGAAGGLSAIVAVILTVGVLNAYVAGASKLGAALGRDGSLPRWFATGTARGVTPVRSLAVAAAIGSVAFGVLWLNLLPQPSLVLLMTSAIVAVYVAGMAAAVKLLTRRRERVTAMLGLAVALLIASTCGWYLLWPVVIAALAFGYRLRQRGKVERNRLNRGRVGMVDTTGSRQPAAHMRSKGNTPYP